MRTLLFIVLALRIPSGMAQDVEADLQALNAHFSSIATFTVDRDDRLITEYTNNCQAYHLDQV